MRRAFSLLALLLFLLSIPFVHSDAKDKKVAEEEDDEDNYLYGDDEASAVLDYHRPKRVKDEDDKPSFIFDKNRGARIVEFYAPWCPHCGE